MGCHFDMPFSLHTGCMDYNAKCCGSLHVIIFLYIFGFYFSVFLELSFVPTEVCIAGFM